MTNLTLSEALLRGRQTMPNHCVGLVALAEADNGTVPVAACDLGAMAVGFGVDLMDLAEQTEDTWWPGNTPRPFLNFPCKCSTKGYAYADDIVAHLSDTHRDSFIGMNIERWSVDDVAGWLRDVVDPFIARYRATVGAPA